MIFQPQFDDILLAKTGVGLWQLSNGSDQIIYEGELSGISEIQLAAQQLLVVEAALLSEVAGSALVVSGAGSVHVTNLDASLLDLGLANFQVAGELTAGITPGEPVKLDAQTQLGNFRLLLEFQDELIMTGAQADGRIVLRDRSASKQGPEGKLYITNLVDASSADLSNIRTLAELSAFGLDAQGVVAFSGKFNTMETVAIGPNLSLDVRLVDVANLPLAFGVLRDARLMLSSEQRIDWVLKSGFDPIASVGNVEVFGTGAEGILGGNIFGSSGDDILHGIEDADVMFGYAGADRLLGGDNDDELDGGVGDDTLDGGDGNDTLDGGPGADVFNGGAGIDRVEFLSAPGRVLVDLLTDASTTPFARLYQNGAPEGDTFVFVENVTGGRFSDHFRGDNGANVLDGGDGWDRLYGRQGDDTLIGGLGGDMLYGNAGADTMTGGTTGQRDRFIYFRDTDSGVGAGNRDVITDFQSGVDRIEISRIDADTTQRLKQDFNFIGAAAFSNTAGELRYEHTGTATILQADFDGDGTADFEIELTGTINLQLGDFLL